MTVDRRHVWCLMATVLTLTICTFVVGHVPGKERTTSKTIGLRSTSKSVQKTLMIHPDTVPLIVQLRGELLHWRVIYPGFDQRLNTADDLTTLNQIHLPRGTPVTLQLVSSDYLYSFALPQLQLEQIAVPDMMFEMKLGPLATGALAYAGNQFCGGPHGLLSGLITVESSTDFNKWLNDLSCHE